MAGLKGDSRKGGGVKDYGFGGIWRGFEDRNPLKPVKTEISQNPKASDELYGDVRCFEGKTPGFVRFRTTAPQILKETSLNSLRDQFEVG